jgi:hypothetical protein
MSELALTHDTLLAQKIDQIEKEILEAAVADTQNALSNPSYSGPQKIAILEFAKLKQTANYDLLNILIRGKSLSKIHEMKLWTQLPGAFSSAEEAVAVEGKLSKSEQSNIRDLYDTVFPFVQNELGQSLVEFWNNIQWSNIREIIPYLKVVITGVKSKRASVNQAIENIENDVLSLMSGEVTEEEKRKAVAEQLIETAASENNTNLRNNLRPGETPPIDMIVLTIDGYRYAVAKMDEDQFARLQNANSAKSKLFEFAFADAPKRVPIVRELLEA